VKISVDRLFAHDLEAIEFDEQLMLSGELKERYPKGVRVAARITRISHGVFVEGAIDGTERETCARCLEPFFRSAHVEMAEPYSEDVAVKDAQFSDVAPLVGREIKFDELVGELLEVDEPIAAVCGETCLGICPECGVNRNVEACLCNGRAGATDLGRPDERLAGLAKFMQEPEV
jgi:uncharacterized protein